MTPDSRDSRPLKVVIADDITTTHPGRPLDAVIAEVLEGFAARRAAFLARNPDERAYLDSEDDHTIWCGSKLLAVVRAAPGGMPAVTRPGGPRRPVPRPPGPGTPALDGEGPEDLEDLIYRTTDRALARFHEAARFAGQARRVDRRDGGDNRWAALAIADQIDASQHLARVILARDEEFRDWDVHGCLKERWRARGVRSGGLVYLVVPDPVELVVVEAAAVVDMDDRPDIALLGEA